MRKLRQRLGIERNSVGGALHGGIGLDLDGERSEENKSEIQSKIIISYAVF